MLPEYFHLQRTLLHRRFRSWRLAPWFAWGAGSFLFGLVSWAVLDRGTPWAWGYALASGLAVRALCGAARVDFLRRLYPRPEYYQLRLSENLLVATPFALLLLVHGYFAQTPVPWILGGAMVYYVERPPGGRALPTPFGRRPFEFAAATRKLKWFLLGIVGVLIQALRVDNYELAGFLLALTAFLSTTAYAEPEPGELVYAHTMTPREFLRHKALIGARHLALFLAPVALALYVFFPERWLVTTLISFLAFPYIALALLLKYYRFPQTQSVMEGLIFALTLMVPPLLPVALYVYYRRALLTLEPLLP